MIYIGIDNGVSGSIGIVDSEGTVLHFGPTPVQEHLNYTKKVARINRLDRVKFKELLQSYAGQATVRIGIERPMVNPMRFAATISAIRLLESMENCLEDLQLPITCFVDSKEWQKKLLPAGIKGSADLKQASMEVGTRRWPAQASLFKKQKDADGLMIAEYLRRIKV